MSRCELPIMMVIHHTWELTPCCIREAMASLYLDLAGRMIGSEDSGPMFARKQPLTAVGWEIFGIG